MLFSDDRAIKMGEYILQNKTTVRKTAAIFGISKSTVHKDLTEKLPKISKTFFNDVNAVLQENKALRHIRGGEATREKYRRQSSAAHRG